MKVKFTHTIKTKPLFLYLVTLFFVLHGFTENYDFIPVRDALLLTGIYLGVSIGLLLVSWLIFHDWIKASLFAFALLSLQFFFGFFQDQLKKIFPGSFINKYTFILPAIAIALIIIIILLRRRKKPLYHLAFYLNLLFIILIGIDTVSLVSKAVARKETTPVLPAGTVPCSDCSNPDVWFILADEYAGNTELKDIFHYDDSSFIRQLETKGFYVVPESYSNYNYTPFSLASILNMDYLPLKDKERGKSELAYCYQMIRDSRLPQFFQANGYTFYNYSVFDFKGQPSRTHETFLAAKTRLITSQTFLSRLRKHIGFNLVTKLKAKRAIEANTYSTLHNNNNIYSLTWNTATDTTHSPKFIYTHLMLPHYPYYFDSAGKEMPFEILQEGHQHLKEAYIGYLQYSNKKLMELVDHILRSSAKPPVIILMGDHGFRHFREPVDHKYYYLNLLSVYLPSKKYAAFSDSLTCVNVFRTLLNTEFGQHLPVLKDSTIYIKD